MIIQNIFNTNSELSVSVRRISFKPDDIALHHHNLPWFCYLKSPLNHSTSRYSFIGLSPFLVLQGFDNYTQFHYNGHTFKEKGTVFQFLKEVLNYFTIKKLPLDIPFLTGGIGYFGYDLVYHLEKLSLSEKDELKIPDSIWVFYDLIYIYDHFKKEAYLSAINLPNEKSNRSFQNANDKISLWEDSFTKKINSTQTLSLNGYRFVGNDEFKTNLSKEEYLCAVHRIKEFIMKGDIYQANLTYRYQFPFSDHPFTLFQLLTETNPTPFSAYLNFNDFQVLSFSPERFVQCVNANILVQPMKGTRPRMKNPLEDEKQKLDLLNSGKDAAELIMIVDLMRNDLGRVSDFGSVIAEKLKNLEIYTNVYQLTASISSKLKAEYDLIDLITALFPAGSITGCPKVKAMEILSSLEPCKRSLFMGSIGYISFHNTLDLNVAIRTAIYRDNLLYFQVGGGIIHDSDPEMEYQETLDKSAFLFDFLKGKID